MKVHLSPRYSSFPGLQRDYGSPGKLLLNYLSGTHNPFPLPPQPAFQIKCAGECRSLIYLHHEIPHESAVLSFKSQERWHQGSPLQIWLGLWRPDPLDLPLAYSMLDAVLWGERGWQRNLGFFFKLPCVDPIDFMQLHHRPYPFFFCFV